MNEQQMKLFKLNRKTDPTGISGTGVVAAGCVLPSGKVVLEWRGPRASITLHENIENVIAIHCHNGATVIEWELLIRVDTLPVSEEEPDLDWVDEDDDEDPPNLNEPIHGLDRSDLDEALASNDPFSKDLNTPPSEPGSPLAAPLVDAYVEPDDLGLIDMSQPHLAQKPTVENVQEVIDDLERDKRAAAQWARDLLTKGNFVVVDTETTGLEMDDQIIQIGIVDPAGNVILDQLIKPTKPITNTAWHGLTDESVKDAPSFPEVHEKICAALTGKKFVAYNSPFDCRMLNQVCVKHDLKVMTWGGDDCVMQEFAAFYGEWNDYRGNYKWQKLQAAASYFDLKFEGQAHSAVADCKMTLAVMKKMAEYQPAPSKA
jgi:DNA polymerase-3 subunit epsilon